MNTTDTGRRGERMAQRYLQGLGYRLLQKNYRSGHHEIDLIMADGDTVMFVEVKARSGAAFGTPAEQVTPRKQRFLRLAAEAYLMQAGLSDRPARFDVAEVYLAENRVNHIVDAF